MSGGRPTSVAVVGAGIGGLTAAAALHRLGVSVEVYEQTGRFGRVGAGIQVNPNAVKVLRGIGVEQAALDRGFQAQSQLTRDAITGEVVRDLVMPVERYGAAYLCMHRADLHSILADTLPNASIHLNKRLVGVDQDRSGIRLAFADGSTAAADAVIGADGMHSIVREHVVGPLEAAYNGRSAFRSVLTVDHLDRDFGDSRTLWLSPNRHFLIYHVSRDRRQICFATGQPDSGDWISRESWSATGDVGQLRATFADFHPDVLAMIDACSECHLTGMSDLQPLARWHDGRAALLGDACHVMPPRMASGAAMAIEDAAVLARCIADTDADDIQAAFARYEAHRRPRASLLQAIAADPRAAARRGEKDMTWLYGHDAWTASLDSPPEVPDSVATAV